MSKALRDRILALFDPEVATSLVRFADHIRAIDAEYLIFVARKSLRLYDMLVRLGLASADKVVLSDRVLEVSPAALTGKRIALIDDSLIVGTTLAKIKARIENSISTRVTSHVFCINTEWWNPEIFEPDVALMELDDRQTMTFCATEIKALSALAIPYLVDFPFSSPLSIRLSNFEKLFGSLEWEAHCLSTPMQEQWGTYVHTFLPGGDILSELERMLGPHIFEILDISKIRAFSRSESARGAASVVKTTFVPLVTIKPVSIPSIDRIFAVLAERLSRLASTKILVNSFETPIAKARFIQYALSVAVGDRFFKSASTVLPAGTHACSFDETEAMRHFGPWLLDDIRVLHRYAYDVVFDQGSFDDLKDVRAEPTPPTIIDTISDVLDSSPKAIAGKKNKRERENCPSNILTDFSEVFIDLFDKHEIPAREEAKKYGRKVLDPNFPDASHRNRLEIGIPWSQIVTYLSELYSLKQKPNVSNIISLLMDFWHDMGIAVPIFSVRDNTVIRAYRHGEDVKITNQELALIHELVDGFVGSAERASVPRLVLEKMLVCWARLGLAKDWLTPTWGPTGADGVARIGYYLKGAILFKPNRSESVLATDRGTWLSSYCIYRGVLRHNESGQFVLGNSIDANFERAWAPHESRKVGRLFGLVTRPGAPLADDDRKRIVLATCLSPRDLAGAIEAELQIIHDWCQVALPSLARSVRFNDGSSIREALSKLRKSHASEAIFSARMKYLGYLRRTPKQIVDECYKYIWQENKFAADEWSALWSPLVDRSHRLEEQRLLPPIRTAIGTVFQFGICILLMELSLIIALGDVRRRKRSFPKTFLRKLNGFLGDLRSAVDVSGDAERLLDRVDKLTIEKDFSKFTPATVWHFALSRIEKNLIDVFTDKEHLYILNGQIGKSDFQECYSHMVWYDIIGSTGERFGLTGQEKAEHERRVVEFKGSVTRALNEVRKYLTSKKGEIFAWNGTVESRNDEKHLFLRGPGDLQQEFVDLVVHAIMRETYRFERTRVRMIMLPCTFANSEVRRSNRGTEVVGDRFWVHSARLKDQLKKREIDDFDIDKNILYVCTDGMINTTRISSKCLLVGPISYDIATSPDALALNTKVVGWNLVGA